MTPRIQRRKSAQQELRELESNALNVYVVHYSCESFYDRPDGRTPRITSIAVRNYRTGQTHSFSIHKVAEIRGVARQNISAEFDTLEREMLDEFFLFVRAHLESRWVHWNMRDINYGFPAIEHRYRILGGTPSVIDDSKKYDLARILIDLYGPAYAGHPRLVKLMEKNNISARDFLSGREEANAFELGDYVQLHQSTLRKADIIANIFERTNNGLLITDARWREIYGFTSSGISELLKEHPLVVTLGILGSVASLIGLMSLLM